MIDTSLPGWPTFTGAAQIAQLRRTVTHGGSRTVEAIYLITSAPPDQAPPALLASWVQQHWSIENRLQHVRDTSYDEDRSQVRTATLPKSWPASAPPRSPSTASRAPPTSQQLNATTPETPTAPSPAS